MTSAPSDSREGSGFEWVSGSQSRALGSSLAYGTEAQNAASLAEGVGKPCTGQNEAVKRRKSRKVGSILQAGLLDIEAAIRKGLAAMEERGEGQIEKQIDRAKLRGWGVNGQAVEMTLHSTDGHLWPSYTQLTVVEWRLTLIRRTDARLTTTLAYVILGIIQNSSTEL